MVEITEVRSKKDFRNFIGFPYTLYRGNNFYVPDLYVSQKMMFSRTKNPFFNHSKAAFFLAYIEKQVAGRIALIRNNNYIRNTGENDGFFGFFETIKDYDVAKALFDKALDWMKTEKLTKLIGPENFTTNDSCGTLVSGFYHPPVVMMPYNMDYYNEFMIRYGFEKVMDLLSYRIEYQSFKIPAMNQLTNHIEKKLADSGITIRTINFKKFKKEIVPFCEVYNNSNRNNWGFIPLTGEEFSHTALQIRQVAPESLILLAEHESRLIGFIVALPDINQALAHIRNGKLFPAGLFKLIYFRRKINNARILILGILQEYRNRGIDLILYKKIQENLAEIGIHQCEACYVMDNNLKMRRIIEKIGGMEIKRYRIYSLGTK